MTGQLEIPAIGLGTWELRGRVCARIEATSKGLTCNMVRMQTIKAGTGPMPGPEDVVRIDYVGRLAGGHVFDRAKGAGMRVAGTVPGFAEALQRMRKGGIGRIARTKLKAATASILLRGASISRKHRPPA